MMMKNLYPTLRKAGLSVFLCLAAVCTCVQGYGQANTDKRITIRQINAPLEHIFNEINEQTGSEIFYNAQRVSGMRSSVDLQNALVADVVAAALKDHPLSFRIDNGVIVISAASAQAAPTVPQPAQRNIQGTVTDAHGNPVIGANVVAQGTTIGTTSDSQGQFRLTVPAHVAQLEVSFVGMATRMVELSGVTEYRITLEESNDQIDDVVVTGYYNQARTTYTGASRTITAQELQSAGNQNVFASLRNVDPSFVQVENNLAGSDPNSLPDFQIRGQSSLTGMRDEYAGNPNMPLFILDGFEVTAEKVYDLDIYRVGTITILKDASATAIYGSRASNGVVVITTNTPSSGKLYISYNLDMTFAVPDLSGYDLLNASEKLYLERAAGMFILDPNMSATSQERLSAVYNDRLKRVTSGVDTYWLKKPLNAVSIGHKHSLRLDGGSDSFRYGINLAYNDNPGVMKRSRRTRQGIGMQLRPC